MEEIEVILTCTCCKKTKPSSLFPKQKNYKSGFSTWCKDCHKNAVLLYAKRNPDKIKHRNKLSRDKIDKLLLSKKQREYQSKNRKELNEKRKIYRLKNKKLIAAIDINARAKRKNCFTDLSKNVTPSFLLNLKKEATFCEICGILPTEKKFELDHILPIISGGKHEINNLRYICYSCNRSRPTDGSDLINTKYEFLIKK